MKYQSGEIAKVGDIVCEADGLEGVVLCCMETGEYTEENPKEQWSYLKSGIMIHFDMMGLVHYEGPMGLTFLRRAK